MPPTRRLTALRESHRPTRRPLILAGLCFGLGWLAACELPEDRPEEPKPVPAPVLLTTQTLPPEWSAGSPRQFQAWYTQAKRSGALTWDGASRSTLLGVLQEPVATPQEAERAVRAALCLALDAAEDVPGALYLRLERHFEPAERGYAAAELVLARALGQRQPLPAPWPGHLRELAAGAYPHPVLDVRVECARAFLESYDPSLRPVPLTSQKVLRFLLRVLRAETPDQRLDPPDWKRVETLAWTKARAADTLRRWLPDAGPYTPDGSWPDQNDWARAAEAALGLDDR